MQTITKVSEIVYTDLADYLRLDDAAAERTTLTNLLGVAKSFIQGYTGLTAAELDAHEDFVIAVFVLVQDMFDNRTYYVDNGNLNKVVETILGLHRVNLL